VAKPLQEERASAQVVDVEPLHHTRDVEPGKVHEERALVHVQRRVESTEFGQVLGAVADGEWTVRRSQIAVLVEIDAAE
jgi:hypothetical protein